MPSSVRAAQCIISSVKEETSFRCSLKNSRIYVANRLNVGDWWPRQLAALQDGAHGSYLNPLDFILFYSDFLGGLVSLGRQSMLTIYNQ